MAAVWLSINDLYGFYMARTHILNVITALILFPLALSACNSREPYESELPVLKAGDPVLALGDDLTAGVGLKKDAKPYPEQLTKISGLMVTNAGKQGDTTHSVLSRLSDELRASKPKLVIVILGANDFATSVSHNQSSENLKKIITYIRRASAEPLLVAVPTKGLVRADARFYYEVAKKFRVPLISGLITELLDDSDYRSEENENSLNEAGQKKLAEEIDKYLRKNGALK